MFDILGTHPCCRLRKSQLIYRHVYAIQIEYRDVIMDRLTCAGSILKLKIMSKDKYNTK